MDLLKKILLAVFVGTAMIATAPVTLAAGKVENATKEEVAAAIVEAIDLSEQTLAAVQAGDDKDKVMEMLKSIKQASKRIESNIVDRLRSKANSRVSKARSAFKKGDNTKAEALLVEAVVIFKEVQSKHRSF
jgi:hypothetical protein